MSAGNPVMEFLSMNGMRLPYLIVYIVGLVMALTTWQRNPKASLFGTIAFVLFILGSMLDAVFTWFLFRSSFGSDLENRSMILGIGHFFFTLLGIAAWVLILCALFGRRRPERTWPPNEPEDYGRRHPESDRPSGPPREDIRR
jgi:hypothetical protein